MRQKEDKICTCYLYTCYCYINEIEVANAILRERFGVDEKNKAIISRIIKETMESGYIKLSDENAVPKMRRYVPYWAYFIFSVHKSTCRKNYYNSSIQMIPIFKKT